MKKIVGILAILALIFIGGNYYVANKTQEHFEKNLESFTKANGLTIAKKSYDKGFFSSNGNCEIKISKEKIKKTFGIRGIEDILISVKSDIKHSLFGGVDSKSEIRVVSKQQEAIKKLFGSNKIGDIFTKKGLGGDINTKVALQDLSIKENGDEFKIKDFSFGVISDIKLNVKSMDFEIKNIEISNNIKNEKFKIKDVKYFFKADKLVDYETFFTKLYESSGESSIDEITLNSRHTNVKVSKISTIGSLKKGKNDEFLDTDNVLKIKKIDTNGIKFNDANILLDIKNLHKKSINELIKYTRNADPNNFSLGKIQNLVAKIISYEPKLELKSLNFKNDKNKKADLSFRLSAKDINPNDLDFNGKLITDTKLSDFLYQIKPLKPMLDSVQDKLFRKQNGKYELKFAFDKSKMDIIINDSTPLRKIF